MARSSRIAVASVPPSDSAMLEYINKDPTERSRPPWEDQWDGEPLNGGFIMKSLKTISLILVTGVGLLMSCASKTTATPQTLLSPTITAVTPTPTPTLPPQRPVACQNLQHPAPIDSDAELAGVLGLVLPLANGQPGSGDVQVLLGGSSLLEEQPFMPLSGRGSIGFTPDGKWFAYQVLNMEPDSPPDPFIYLISSKGEEVTTPLPLEEGETNGQWASGWINNEYMLLVYGLPSESEDVSHRAFTVVNPFTGEERPELLDSLPYWNGETAVYVSPDMTRVVYAGRTEEDPVLVLWDVGQQRVIWQKLFIGGLRFDEQGIGMMSGFGKVATWAPDSAGFIFSASEQLENDSSQYRSYLIDRNGTQEQVLIDTLDRNGNVIYGGVWSPNSRYIAYFRANTIILYDFVSNEVIELCHGLPPYINQVLWSPDSQATT